MFIFKKIQIFFVYLALNVIIIIIIIICSFWKSYLSLFFLVGFLFSLLVFSILFLGFVILIVHFFCFVCVGKGKPILCVLSNCSNKDQCHMWVGLLVKWWTTNKIGINVQVGKSCLFQVAHFIKYSNMGCAVHPPHVMTKLKKDENLASLIWASKVFYAMSLRDVWDSQNWTKFSSKKEYEKEIIWLVDYHKLEIIHDR
jgi:hypothetical protein